MTTNIKAVFTDMDGTLLNPHHHVTPYTIDVLQKLKEKGIKFIIATGRPYADVFGTLDKTGLRPDYIITCNGGRVHDGNRTLLSAHNLPAAVVKDIVNITQQPNADGTIDAGCGPKLFATNIYQEDRWLGDKEFPDICPGFDERFVMDVRGDTLSQLTEAELEGVHQVWFQAPRADLEPLHAYMQRNFADRTVCCYSLPTIVDCVPTGVNKGKAMTEVCALLGIPLAEVAAFGDGMNDLSMLKIAGRAFVMENAHPSVGEAIPEAERIGDNANDGVAKKLDELFLKQ